MENTNTLEKAIKEFEDNRQKLTSVKDEELTESLQKLISDEQSNLRGEYDLYTIYQVEGKERYALIYAFYLEIDGLSYGQMDYIPDSDGKYLHQSLKQSGLALDYLFIVPYYDYIDKKEGSVMMGAVVTKGF